MQRKTQSINDTKIIKDRSNVRLVEKEEYEGKRKVLGEREHSTRRRGGPMIGSFYDRDINPFPMGTMGEATGTGQHGWRNQVHGRRKPKRMFTNACNHAWRG